MGLAMFDMTNAQRSDATVDSNLDSQNSLPDLEGFAPEEITRLSALREQIRLRGQRDRHAEEARLRFARWRYEQGYMNG
jgi:hypothetical protein